MTDALLPALFLISVFYIIYRFYHWQKYLPQKQEQLYYKNLCESIHVLDGMAKELETLEEIITDLSICNTDAVKGVRIIVPNLIGQDNEYTVLTDGESFSSEQLLAIAYSEREYKQQQIVKAISDLNSGGVVTRLQQPEGEESDGE